MKLVEPISRSLIRLGKLYLNVMTKSMDQLDINRYYYILTCISYYDGKLTQKALAQLLDKDKSAMVSIIDMLTDKGYVYREVNPSDRREHLLKVTEKAKKAVPQITAAFEEMNKSITHGISAGDMEIFESVLKRMQDNLKLTCASALETSPNKPNDLEI